jgi:Zn-dependent protease
MFPQSGIVLGEIAGIQIRLHWSFLLAAAWWLQSEDFDPQALILLGVLFITVLIHELGHCFAARSVGGTALAIVLWPLGGMAYTQANRGNVLHSIWISLAGPLTHVPIALACAASLWLKDYPLQLADLWPLSQASAPLDPVGMTLFLVFKMQLILFCLNVFIPAFPLDGGQVLASLLSLVVPLSTSVVVMTAITAGAALLLYSWDEPVLALFLALQITTLLRPVSDFHPLARFYNRPGVIHGRTATFVAPETQLKACSQCGQKLHPQSELCAYCGRQFPFGQS